MASDGWSLYDKGNFPSVASFTPFWPSLSQRFPQQFAASPHLLKSSYRCRPVMHLSTLQYADGPLSAAHRLSGSDKKSPLQSHVSKLATASGIPGGSRIMSETSSSNLPADCH
jgi:hypothetical protein